MSGEHPSGNKAQHTYHARMILLGEAGTGKSCLFHRIKYKTFRDGSDPQSAENPQSFTHTRQLYDSYTTNIKLSGGIKISFAIFDTAGRERFQSLTAQYYRHINLVLLVCSADSGVTLTKLSKWYGEAKNYIDDAAVTYALCITKSDLPAEDKEVTRGEIDSFAEHCGILQKHIFEISAKTGDNVLHMVKELCAAVIESNQIDRLGNESLVPEPSEASSLVLSVPNNMTRTGDCVIKQPANRSCCKCCVVL